MIRASDSKRRALLMAALAVPAASMAPDALAQAFPTKPIRIVVGFPPGNTLDIIARVLGEHMRTKLGQPVLVENKPGANGILAATEVARAAPDGYTILCTNSSSIVVNPQIYKKISYQAAEFAPLSMVILSPMILTVNPANEKVASVNSMADYIALAKAKPGQMSYSSGGLGNLAHLGMEMLNNRAGIKTTHVPYKGSTAAQGGLLGREVDAQFDTPLAVPLVKSGKLKALAVTGTTRLAELPNVPTVGESGYPGMEFAFWLGLLLPAQTPPAIVQALSDAIRSVRDDPNAMRQLALQGGVTLTDPATFGERIRREYALWGEVIKRENIQVD
jgi:tripartite-type tricarboxylate transporter receptor subunit TctC